MHRGLYYRYVPIDGCINRYHDDTTAIKNLFIGRVTYDVTKGCANMPLDVTKHEQ